jgi:hypothetical protein
VHAWSSACRRSHAASLAVVRRAARRVRAVGLAGRRDARQVRALRRRPRRLLRLEPAHELRDARLGDLEDLLVNLTARGRASLVDSALVDAAALGDAWGVCPATASPAFLSTAFSTAPRATAEPRPRSLPSCACAAWGARGSATRAPHSARRAAREQAGRDRGAWQSGADVTAPDARRGPDAAPGHDDATPHRPAR